MKGRQFLIERVGDGFMLRIDYAKNSRKPMWDIGRKYAFFPTALQGIYDAMMGDLKTPEQRRIACSKMRRMKVTVLFDEETLEKVTVKEL